MDELYTRQKMFENVLTIHCTYQQCSEILLHTFDDPVHDRLSHIIIVWFSDCSHCVWE